MALPKLDINLDNISPPDRVEYAIVFGQLSEYANKKGEAEILRKEGKISKAQRLEDAADGLYRRLPEWARW